MREITHKALEERKNKVLQAVIHQYIKTAKPVGSKALSNDYGFVLSPATIRALMSELEDDGYLTHPHTSAGRVPTDKGYRTYVDSLLELQMLAIEEEDRLRHEYTGRMKELEQVLVQTSKALSALSNYTGFVITPKLEKNRLKYIELVHLNSNQFVAILVTHTGLVKHHVIKCAISAPRIERLNAILNEKLRDMTLLEAKEKILEKIEEAEREELDILSFAREISSQIFDIEEEMYIEGASNVLTFPEFHDYEPMRNMLKLTEEKKELSRMLAKDLDSDKVKVTIGSESSLKELQHMSVVSTVYKDGKRSVGVLGIIGPKRMEYPRMMALVDSVSKIVSNLLEEIGG